MNFSGPVKTYHTDTYPAIDPTSPRLSTKGKNIVISGGGSGIGREIARSFAKSGASTISILGRREKTLLETKTQLEKDYPDTKAYMYVADIAKRDQLDTAFQVIHSVVGAIHVLIANAGYMAAFQSFSETDPEEWWNCFEVNVKGNFNFVTAFLPFAAKDATIINISSGQVNLAVTPGFSAYHASKLAAVNFFQYVHYEHPDFTVISIHPGAHKTEMDAKVPLGTSGFDYDEVSLPGDSVVWAVSSEAKFLNGKFFWAHWDVDELKAMSREIEDTNKLTFGLLGAQ
ncbi:NAD(P)-binding protein [Hyaloscypha bicolor E]|uniref:NAD(P)-binding protein n=1 Tax=Hyaloscypha bicolor E TaxID=1095630 RepID=A0A2J6SJR5_9HELO|nr:NAD(P)-binding protein [Hyaloscypha bicolor E]PMD51005.1 NAD(P)-binding protein [Hyaloscypha bicolor E]